MNILPFYKYFSFLLIFGLFIHSSYGQDSNKVDLSKSVKTQDSLKVIYLLVQSKTHFTQNDSIALAYGNEALKIAKETANQDLILTCYNQLLHFYYYQFDDIDSAKDISRQGEQTALKSSNIEEKAKFYLLNGQIHNKAKEFSLAQFYFEKSINGYQQAKKTDSLYTLYLNLVKIHQIKHEYDIGAKYAFKSLTLAEYNNNLDKIAESRKAVGDINLYQNNYDIALNNFVENLKYYEKTGDTLGISNAMNGIGLTYYYIGENELSITYSEKSLALRKMTGNKLGLAQTYNNLSLPYYRSKNWEQCLIYFNKSLDLYIELNVLEYIPTVLINIGDVKFEQGNFDEAIVYFEKAFDYQKKNDIQVAQLNYNNNLYESFLKKREYQKALKHYELYNIYKDSIAIQKQKQFISELNIQYESEKKEDQLELSSQEIKLLEASQEVKNLKINNQKKRLSILTIVFIIVMILLLIVYMQMKSKNKAYKILVEKNLEIANSERNHKSIIYKQKDSQKIIETDLIEKTKKYAESQLTSLQKQQLLEAIFQYIEEDKPYLDKGFTINILSKKLNSSRSYVSQVINEELKCNFSQFINKYRIKDARLMLSNPGNNNLTIEFISFSVGFGSKSSFNNAFKNYTGITPSFYIKSLN
jgi:AraC-like DNA-binding protein